MTRAFAILCASAWAARAAKPPHIVFIVADDLGWNDVSLHGSPQIPTPHIDEIGATGTRLQNYFVQPVCSPSRSSFLSGRHVIHTGIYMPFDEGSAQRLHLNYTLLPQYLQSCCGYDTHAVGKWHLGQNVRAALPTGRGFNSHIGYWSGAETYFTHESGKVANNVAYDFSDATAAVPSSIAPATQYNGTWSPYILAGRAIELIANASKGGPSDPPVFMYLAFQNVHWPLEAPQEYIDRFNTSAGGDTTRQLVCAMAAFLNDAVGNVTAALKAYGLWEDTILVFTSDNGGPEHGDEGTSSNNYPLRGGKNTLWMGGTKVIGYIRGPGIRSNYDYTGLMHATDWLPTLVSAVSGKPWTDFTPPNEPPYLAGDGMDLWPSLSAQGAASPRDWILLETHPNDGSAPPGQRTHGDGYIHYPWKIVRWDNVMPQVENGWFPPSGQDPNSVNYTVKCGAQQPANQPNPTQCAWKGGDWCLFNIETDPCEYNDVSAANPTLVQQLIQELSVYAATAVPPVVDEGCQPITVKLPNGMPAWQPCDA